MSSDGELINIKREEIGLLKRKNKGKYFIELIFWYHILADKSISINQTNSYLLDCPAVLSAKAIVEFYSQIWTDRAFSEIIAAFS